MKIAIVQAACGHVTCVGPNDYEKGDHDDAMSAAIGWHLEAGYVPAATYWADVDLPPLPSVPIIPAVTLPSDQGSAS